MYSLVKLIESFKILIFFIIYEISNLAQIVIFMHLFDRLTQIFDVFVRVNCEVFLPLLHVLEQVAFSQFYELGLVHFVEVSIIIALYNGI